MFEILSSLSKLDRIQSDACASLLDAAIEHSIEELETSFDDLDEIACSNAVLLLSRVVHCVQIARRYHSFLCDTFLSHCKVSPKHWKVARGRKNKKRREICYLTHLASLRSVFQLAFTTFLLTLLPLLHFFPPIHLIPCLFL